MLIKDENKIYIPSRKPKKYNILHRTRYYNYKRLKTEEYLYCAVVDKTKTFKGFVTGKSGAECVKKAKELGYSAYGMLIKK